MKKILIAAICFCLSLSRAAYSNRTDNPSYHPSTPETAAQGSSDMKGNESEDEMKQDIIEFGLTINDTYYPIPSALKQFFEDGWSISAQTPYFLHPMVSEDYYERRADWSLSPDGEGIYPGGSIIRLLEKEGVLLEVTIANQADPKKGDQKIVDGIVESITVFYDEMHTSIKLNDSELSSLTPESLQASYPVNDGWTHAPSNYRNHPEFGISTDYDISRNLDNCNRSIVVYFNLKNIAFKITVLNEMPLNFIPSK